MFAFVILIALSACGDRGSLMAQIGAESHDDPVYDFLLPMHSMQGKKGQEVRLSDQLGRVVVVNFWATWCPPCVAEMPGLEKLGQALEGKPFALLAVNTVTDDAAVTEFFSKHGSTTLTVLRDPGARMAKRWGTAKFPETYVLNKRGRLVAKIIGPRDWSSPKITALLESLASE